MNVVISVSLVRSNTALLAQFAKSVKRGLTGIDRHAAECRTCDASPAADPSLRSDRSASGSDSRRARARARETNDGRRPAGRSAHSATPHRKNAALRSESPYQQRTTQRDNPTQQLIKQAVDYLLQQLEAGKSETLTAYLAAMARFHAYSFGNILSIARQRAVT